MIDDEDFEPKLETEEDVANGVIACAEQSLEARADEMNELAVANHVFEQVPEKYRTDCMRAAIFYYVHGYLAGVCDMVRTGGDAKKLVLNGKAYADDVKADAHIFDKD